jgi:hypothetical protein
MAGTVKQKLGLALRMMMKPLVRLLISQGITYGEFCDAAKDVYVETTIRYFSDDKKVNKSKVAIITGLTRKEVANVLARAIDADTHMREFSRPSRVLSGWHSDPAYTGPYGMPLEIPYDTSGQSGKVPSFVHLVRTYSGDMPVKGMLEELIRGGAVVKQENDYLKVIRRDFEPGSLSPQLIERFGDVGFNILSTVSSNVEKDGTSLLPFDRVVFSDNPMSESELEDFDKYLKLQGQRFLEQVDIWFSSNIKKKDLDEGKVFDTGVAMIQYIEWEADAKSQFRDYLMSIGYDQDSSD